MKNILNEIKKEILAMETINEEELTKIFQKHGLDENDQETIINYLLNDMQETKTSKEEPTKEDLEEIELEEQSLLEDEDEYDDSIGYTPDPVKNYLMQIGKIPLLDKEEERLLFLQIEKTRKQIKNCTNEKEKEILEEKLDALQKQATEHNLRLVVSIAKIYTGRGLDLLDLIQEGNIGLMKAIEKFEVNKGFKFSTYAHWWIKQAITRSLADKARTIRIPVHMSEQVNKFTRFEKNLAQELQRDPTEKELAEKLNMSIDKVKEMKLLALPLVSLQAPIGEEEDSTLLDFIEDDADPLEQQVERIMLKKYLEDFLDGKLSEQVYGNQPGQFRDRELQILKLRFGFNEKQKAYTLEEIGNKFDITRERVRQIEGKALSKLKRGNNSVGRHIKSYARGRRNY